MKCDTCKQGCPQSTRAHQAALDRKYTLQELVSLIKDIETGKLFRRPNCSECYYREYKYWYKCKYCIGNMNTTNNFLAIPGIDKKESVAHWIDNADSYICSNCGYETNNPNKEPFGRCPSCGL